MTLRPWRFLGWTALGLILLHSLALDWRLITGGGSIDFRNRITGARLLLAGRDAYHFKWSPADPAEWCDLYDNRALPITKTTVTPAMLLLHAPVAAMPYPAAQRLWLVVSWLLLAAVWAQWRPLLPAGLPRTLWTVAVVVFTYTLAWRHHVDRGQAYVILAFFLSWWLTRTLCPEKDGDRLTGFLAGVLCALRPPIFLFLAPFLFLRRRSQVAGAALGLLVAGALPTLVNGSSWSAYGKAMGEWSTIYRTDQQPRPGGQAYPPAIEGLPLDLMARYSVRQYADSSLFRLFRGWGWAPLPAFPFLAALVMAFALWMAGARQAAEPVLLAGLGAWIWLGDFFLPAYRNPYNDVMVAALVPAVWVAASGRHRVGILAGAGGFLVLGWILVAILPPARWMIHLPTWAWLAVVPFVLVLPFRRAPLPATA